MSVDVSVTLLPCTANVTLGITAASSSRRSRTSAARYANGATLGSLQRSRRPDGRNNELHGFASFMLKAVLLMEHPRRQSTYYTGSRVGSVCRLITLSATRGL